MRIASARDGSRGGMLGSPRESARLTSGPSRGGNLPPLYRNIRPWGERATSEPGTPCSAGRRADLRMRREIGIKAGVFGVFFGKDWGWSPRLSGVDFLRDYGYGLYIYAPKAEAYLRRRWREP